MRYEPRKHQIIAEDFCAEHDRCGLFIEMGLGKTVVSLTSAERRMYRDFSVNKVLVIAPKRVAEDTWTRETEKWDHLHKLRVVKAMGPEKKRLEALRTNADIYVINRENVEWLVTTLMSKDRGFGSWPFEMVILDELSSFKSSRSKRWRSLRRVIGLSTYVIGLTGTPAPNGYLDLWPEMYLIDGGERLGKSITAFREHFFTPGARKGHIVYEWKLKTGAKEAIDRAISDVCLSMKAEDWIDLPPVVLNTVTVRLDVKGRRLYDQFERERVIPLLDGEEATVDTMGSAVMGDMAATVSNKLLQMANGSVYDDAGGVFHIHDKKLEALDELIEASQGQPVLVFYSYKHDLHAIQARHPEARELTGSDTIDDWNAGKIPVLLCHPASAGHGLNLQGGGHIIIWYGLPWSLELYQQANARLKRMGQQAERVIIHHLICENTLDERVMTALTKKDAVQRGLLDALKDYLKNK